MINKLDFYLKKWEKIFNDFGCVATLSIVLIITADVILRNAFDSSFRGASEIVNYLLLPSIICGAVLQQGNKKHIVLEFFTEKARPIIQKTLDLFGVLIGLFIFGFALPRFIIYASRSVAVLEESSGAVRVPVWPFKCILAVFVVSMVLRLLLDVFILSKEIVRIWKCHLM